MQIRLGSLFALFIQMPGQAVGKEEGGVPTKSGAAKGSLQR
jgi:hypothetical protein